MIAVNKKYRVCIIGGGIAGLSAAVFASRAGFDVTLIESKPRLGGRAYSFIDKNTGDVIDNGQHILASWYKTTLEFFSIIGSIDKIKTQKGLNIKFHDLQGNYDEFRCPGFPAPFHLLFGIIRYKALRFKDKVALISLLSSLILKDFEDDLLRQMTVRELFEKTKQTNNLINKFWEPFIVAVFNSKINETSAFLFKEIIELGFIKKGGSDLILPLVNLNELYIEPSEEYLYRTNCHLFKGVKIQDIVVSNNKIDHLITNEGIDRYFDYYISAVSFFEAEIFSEFIVNKTTCIKPSAILNIHIFFEEEINNIFTDDFIGIVEANIQWIFKVSNKHLCVVISSANKMAEMDKQEIFDLTYSELTGSKPEIKNFTVRYYKVIKEKKATFIPDNITNRNRPSFKTNIENLFLSGDWINTNLPCTIESAVFSSKRCIEHILESVN